MTHQPSPLRRAQPFAAPAALLVAWLALVAWRPWVLGFYHDDWSSVALPLDRASTLAELLALDPGRPLYLVLLRALRVVFGANAWCWQASLALIHLGCAWAVGRAAQSLNASGRAGLGWSGTLAAVAWLTFPWSLGYSAWPVMLPPLVGVAMAAGALALFAQAPERRVNQMLAAALLAGSWAIYEATWFFWVPIAILVVVRSRGRLPAMAWQGLAGLAVLQAAFIVVNRLLAAGSPLAKQASNRLVDTLAVDSHLVVAQLLPLVDRVTWPLALGLAVLCGCALVSAGLLQLPRLLSQAALAILGIALAVLLYAAAGYAIEWEGLFSRVTLPVSFWLAILVGALASPLDSAAAPVRILGRVGALVACGALAVPLVQQSRLWAASWREQQQILAAMPAQLLSVAGRGTLVLMDVPRGPAPVYNFSAFWDISGALAARLERHRTRMNSTEAYASVLRPGEWRTTYDGKAVAQAWCTSPDAILWKLPARRAFLWHYPGTDVTELPVGYDSGCARKP